MPWCAQDYSPATSSLSLTYHMLAIFLIYEVTICHADVDEYNPLPVGSIHVTVTGPDGCESKVGIDR